MAASGFGAILLTLGAYLLIRCFKWEKNVAAGWNEVKSGFLTGKLSIYTYILAIIILIAFGLFAYYNTDFTAPTEFLPIINFIKIMIPGFVIAGLIAVFGRAVDIYVRDKKTPSTYLVAPFSLFAFGFISFAVFGAFHEALIDTSSFNIDPFIHLDFLGFTFTGIMIALIGAIVYHYNKESRQTEEKELEIEEQTSKMVEKN